MRIRSFALLTAAAFALLPSVGSAQDALSQAKAVYASADYEQALTLLGNAPDSREVHYYRALCLLALGRAEAADTQLAAVVSLDPTFAPDPAEVSPRVVSAFTDTRRRLLPQVARDTFAEGRRLFQAGELAKARGRFELTMKLLDDPALENADLADLELVTAGFLDLIPATPAPARAPAAPAAAAPPPAEAAAARPAASAPQTGGVFVAPVTIQQTLPQWRPNAAAARSTFSGAVRVEIDATGRVTSAIMERPVHASYDPLVLAAARNWRYQPATLNGVPTATSKTVEILLRATQP